MQLLNGQATSLRQLTCRGHTGFLSQQAEEPFFRLTFLWHFHGSYFCLRHEASESFLFRIFSRLISLPIFNVSTHSSITISSDYTFYCACILRLFSRCSFFSSAVFLFSAFSLYFSWIQLVTFYAYAHWRRQRRSAAYARFRIWRRDTVFLRYWRYFRGRHIHRVSRRPARWNGHAAFFGRKDAGTLSLRQVSQSRPPRTKIEVFSPGACFRLLFSLAFQQSGCRQGRISEYHTSSQIVETQDRVRNSLSQSFSLFSQPLSFLFSSLIT